ncbi:MAG TPA: SdiA-regulated domain-containing protein [Candidatus Hypogeohydataceae bacterium YC38]|nr:SdiA-regulated domain-containing protein [Candidatus Brocadiales bacterium]
MPFLWVLLIFLFCKLTSATEYKLHVESFPVAVKEPSGLTYDPLHDTLWTVQDGGGIVYEITKKGEVSGSIDLSSNDLEGIAYRPDTQTFLLAEERKREIVEIDRKGKVLKTIKVPISYHLWNMNYGIEGVSLDPKSGNIFVVNEKKPKMVMELKEDGTVLNSFEVKDADDLSDIYYDATTGNLLVLSHESRKVMEFTRKGKLVSSFSIEASKAEGITRDASGFLYIICEKGQKLYIYSPLGQKATSAPRRTR